MARSSKASMVVAMSRPSRKVLRFGAPAAFFAGGVALLVAGGAAGLAWTLIVGAFGWAAHCASAAVAGSPSDAVCNDTSAGRQRYGPTEHRHLAESRRSLSGPR